MKLFYVSLIIIFVTSESLFAQTVKVLNEETGFPIAGVLVYSSQTKHSVETDPEGKFQLDAFQDNDSIVFDHLAFQNETLTKAQIINKEYEIFLLPDIILMQEFIVTTSNVRENTEDLPYKIDIINCDQIQNENLQTTADILTSAGNVTIQKSQGGGGSPVLRGFEANKILLVLDGVRMNNAIYRSGHLQNSITLDNNILSRAEVIFGPTSVIYGSDALGGVVHYYTRDPKLALRRGDIEFHGTAQTQYSTANNAKIGHVDINYGTRKFGSLTSITYSDFGDVKAGTVDDPFISYETGLPDWGLTTHYVTQNALGEDVTTLNPDPYIQKNTAYSQYDFLQKFKYSHSKFLDVILNLQYSTSSNIDRYDALNDWKGGNLKYAEKGYGPQNRLFSSLKFFYKKEALAFTNVKATVGYQKIDEDRYSRKFGKTDKLYQFEDVNVLSMNLDFLKIIKIHRLNYGLEVVYNDVQSKAYYENILTGDRDEAQTRYPDGGSKMYSAAMYANIKWHTTSSLIINFGFRYSFTSLESKFVNNPDLPTLPFTQVKFAKTAPTSSMSFVYFPTANWQLNGMFGSGYRSPNVDDYGKIRAKGDAVTVPNDELRPENAYNAEISLTRTFTDVVSANVSLFKTWLEDAIVRQPYEVDGNSQIEYDGDIYNVITNLNASSAYVQGGSVSLQGNWIFNDNDDHYFRVRATYNEFVGGVGDGSKLAHIAPPFGRFLSRYNGLKFGTQFSVDYQGEKPLAEMGLNGEDNEEEGTTEGFPGWYTLNYAANYKLSKNFNVQFGINNILDLNYKAFASGVSAPGRNFMFTLKIHF